jgi:hypothetical protein
MYGARNQQFFEQPKLMIRDITGNHRLELTADKTGLYCDHTILCAQRAIEAASWRDLSAAMVKKSDKYSLNLLVALLASRLASAYYYWKLSGEGIRIGGGFHTYPKTIRALPVFDIALANAAQFALLKRLDSIAADLLKLNQQHNVARASHQRTVLAGKKEEADRMIDQLVYELYGLADKEICRVERAIEPRMGHTLGSIFCRGSTPINADQHGQIIENPR